MTYRKPNVWILTLKLYSITYEFWHMFQYKFFTFYMMKWKVRLREPFNNVMPRGLILFCIRQNMSEIIASWVWDTVAGKNLKI